MTFISDNAREIFSYSPEELMHDPELWNGLIHPNDKTHALEELKIIDDDHNEPMSIIGCRYGYK